MEDKTDARLEQFDRVWARVLADHDAGAQLLACPISGSRTQGTAERLAAFLEAEERDLERYRELYRRTGGASRRLFCELAAEERRQLRRLRAAYFLLTGDSHIGRPPAEEPAGLMALLRRACLSAAEDAAAYREEAAGPAGEELGSLLRQLAEETAGHARRLRALLERMMG